MAGTREQVKIIIDASGEQAKKAIKSVGRSMEGMGGKMKSAAKVMGAAFVAAGAALGAFMMKSMSSTKDFAVQIDAMAKTTGEGAEELQRLGYAALQEHTSIETLGKGMNKLAKNMGEAKDGAAEYADEFSKVGISVTDANGNLKDSSDVMMELADWMKECDNDAEKQAVAMNILGKQGAEMIPFLEQGSEAIAAMGDEAEELGIVMSDQTVKDMKAYQDSVDKMKGSFQGLQTQTAVALLPAFDGITNALSDMMVKFRESGTLDKIFTAIGDVLISLMPTIEVVFNALGEVLEVLAPIIAKIFGKLGEVFGKILDSVVESGLLDALGKIADILADVFLDVLDAIMPILPDLAEVLADLCEVLAELLEMIMPVIDALLWWASFVMDKYMAALKAGVRIVEWVVGAIHAAFEWLFSAAGAIWDAIKAAWEAVWEAIKATGEAIWNAIKAAIEFVWNAIKAYFETWFKVIKKAWEILWNAIKAVGETVWGAIKAVAERVWGIISGFFKNVWEGFQRIWETAWNTIKTVGETVWNTIKGVAESLWNAIKAVIWTPIETVIGLVTGAWEGVQSALQIAWNNIKKVADFIWGGISSGIKGAINIAISAINAFIRGLNAISGVIDFLIPGVEWGDIPTIPHVAAGAIVRKPTVVLAGEAGEEAIIPLTGRKGKEIMEGAISGNQDNSVKTITVYQEINNQVDMDRALSELAWRLL